MFEKLMAMNIALLGISSVGYGVAVLRDIPQITQKQLKPMAEPLVIAQDWKCFQTVETVDGDSYPVEKCVVIK